MPEPDEWEALRRELRRAGVAGPDDLGRFVSNVEFFGASSLDERAAMPVLLAALPGLADPRLVSAVAGHLRRPWARPHAFDPLLEAFRNWAPSDATTGWHLGDALGSAAPLNRVLKDGAHGETTDHQAVERRPGADPLRGGGRVMEW